MSDARETDSGHSGLRLRAGFMDEWTLRLGLKHEAGSARGWVRKMQRAPSRPKPHGLRQDVTQLHGKRKLSGSSKFPE